jgi:predicted  nucleic acid-binding Zn-ribbon protein
MEFENIEEYEPETWLNENRRLKDENKELRDLVRDLRREVLRLNTMISNYIDMLKQQSEKLIDERNDFKSNLSEINFIHSVNTSRFINLAIRTRTPIPFRIEHLNKD